MNTRISLGTVALIALGMAVVLGAAPATPVQVPATQAATQPAARAATLSEAEKNDGFRLLFDGVTTTGWRQLGGRDFPNGWDIQDGALHHKRGGGGGDITFDEVFENFELRFEFKFPPDGNSGVKYRVVEQPRNSAALGVEYQIVDPNSARADNKNKHNLASLYELVEAKGGQAKPAGQWNEGRIIVRANHFEHWLNGTKVAEIQFGSDVWKTAFAASKWARSNPNFAAESKGRIVLQNHTDEVWFRNIRIKALNSE